MSFWKRFRPSTLWEIVQGGMRLKVQFSFKFSYVNCYIHLSLNHNTFVPFHFDKNDYRRDVVQIYFYRNNISRDHFCVFFFLTAGMFFGLI